MSADNGIYILETEGPEYRVAHLGAIDNLEWHEKYNITTQKMEYFEDDNPDLMIINARKMWAKSPVFADSSSALNRAWNIEKEIGYTEYGICHIRIPRKF